MFQNSNIQGTRPFWFSRGKELLAMCEQLGLPTLFITLSCADFHWPELFKTLSPDVDFVDLSERDRRQLIQDNPLIVDEFFHVRADTFINEVLKKKYTVKDLWFRTEYQHRGSPHVHGVIWLDGAPDVDKLYEGSDEDRAKVAEYFDDLVCAFNPSRNQAEGPIHPCRKKMSEVTDMQEDLSCLLNTVQRHTNCSERYCLRKNKTSQKTECRFKFPVEQLEDKARIILTEDNDVEFIPRRNDPLLNKYNPYIIQSWRANVDVSPVVSRRALVGYLTKYISKPENQSKDFKQILKTLVENANDSSSASHIIRKVFIQMCSERDYSAQEVCHSLMGLKMFQAGARKFINVYFKFEDDEWIPIDHERNLKYKSFVEKYKNRPDNDLFNEICLWEAAKSFELPSGRKHRKAAIVRIHPTYKYDEQNQEKNDLFYKQQVLLYVPWRSVEDFEQDGECWENIYNKYLHIIKSNCEEQVELASVQPNRDDYEPSIPESFNICEQWMYASQMGPNNISQKVELGRRDIDIEHDWHESVHTYEKYGGIPYLRSFLANQKQNYKPSTASSTCLSPDLVLTSEQENILNILDLQIKTIQDSSITDGFALPRKILVQGRAATGKSLVIALMKKKINDILGDGAGLFLGPTGVSALNVNGSTVHSKLFINMNKKKQEPMKGAEAHAFRRCLEKVKFVIVDEFSMVGCKMTNRIDQRLREAKQRPDDDFGNTFVYYFGDVKQLTPVFDSPVYSNTQTSSESIIGKFLYEGFDCASVLTEVKRQNAGPFQNALNNISVGNVCEEDYELLKQRFTTSVNARERQKFAENLHLFSTNSEVHTHNESKIASLCYPNTRIPVPVARIPAVDNPKRSIQETQEDAEGLSKILYLAKGAKIMLRSNLWTERGLVNGSIGEVVDILYEDNAVPQENLPAVLICKFDSFKGPYLDDTEKTVPIIPITKYWEEQEISYSRTNFPISLAYACTIHKAQGFSLDMAYVKLCSDCRRNSSSEMAPGLIYTALSRARSLQGLLLEPFPFTTISSLNETGYIKRRREWEESLLLKLLPNIDLVKVN